MAVPILARSYSNTATPTSLSVSMGSNDATSTLQNISNWPTAPFTICFERNTINQEFSLVTGYVAAAPGAAPSNTPTTTNACYVTRGYNGTAGISHQAGVTVEHCTGAIDYQEANAHHTDTTRDDHAQYLNTARHQNTLIHQAGISIPVATPGSLAIGGQPNAGSSTSLARADHAHGFPTIATIGSSIIPIGSILGVGWGNNITPDFGWLFCAGGNALQSSYPICYQRLGTKWGPITGSGANATFALPNLQGHFIVGGAQAGTVGAFNAVTSVSAIGAEVTTTVDVVTYQYVNFIIRVE